MRYNLKREILKLKTIGATIQFNNGEKPISKFTLLERHFYKNHLLKSFVFDFGFLIPDSENCAEQIYEVSLANHNFWTAVNFKVPKIDKKLMAEIMENPYSTKSDSFYFVDGTLVMHHRADYAYY